MKEYALKLIVIIVENVEYKNFGFKWLGSLNLNKFLSIFHQLVILDEKFIAYHVEGVKYLKN